MAVSKDAGRALSLITGIETCKQVPANFWASAVTRIVLELDERALESELAWLAAKLSEWWDALPDGCAPVTGMSGVTPEDGTDGH